MGNPISGDLIWRTDSFLEDIAQALGPIDYLDIGLATKRLTEEEIKYLDKAAESIAEDDSGEVNEEEQWKYFSFDKDGDLKGIKDKELKRIINKLHTTRSDFEELQYELGKSGIYFTESSGTIDIRLPDNRLYHLQIVSKIPEPENDNEDDEEIGPAYYITCKREN